MRLDLSDDQYRQLRLDLARAVQRACPAWLRSRCDDLIQTAILKLMDIHRRREGNHPLNASYLYRVAYSVMVDEMRRAQWRREVSLGDETAPREPVAREDPERGLLGAEIGDGIEDCLRAVVEDRRLALTLYLQGYSVPEAARTLGWSDKRTENLVYRGLADLRACLAAKGLAP